MRVLCALGLLTLTLLTLPCMAQEQIAYTSKEVHLRAGPARDYPVIAILPEGFEVSVQACLSNYSWCDVVAGEDRGWVYAANIVYAYQDTYVPVRDYGAEIGIAVIGFILFDYWADHYRNHSFYRDRDQWVHRPRPPQSVHPDVVHPEPHGEPRRRSPPGGPDGQHPQPPQPGGPVERHPRPPPPGGPGEQHPQQRQPGGSGEQHPQQPQPGSPSEQHPQPHQHDSPGGQRPQPPQDDSREHHRGPPSREPEVEKR